MKYRVTRAFLLAGVRQEAGAEIDLDNRDLIGVLRGAGKIESVAAAADPVGPMTTETVGGLVAGKPAARARKAADAPVATDTTESATS